MFGAEKGDPEEQVVECSDYEEKDEDDPDNLRTCVGLNSRTSVCAAFCAHRKATACPIRVATAALCAVSTAAVAYLIH